MASTLADISSELASAVERASANDLRGKPEMTSVDEAGVTSLHVQVRGRGLAHGTGSGII